jgi:hypothetical protein
MARGEHRLSAPLRLVAAAAVLLATGGIVAASSTVEAPGGKDPHGMADGSVQFPGGVTAGGPFLRDFVPVELLAPNVKHAQLGSTGSTGNFTSICGTNAEGHRNADNFMGAPGKVNGAQHVHVSRRLSNCSARLPATSPIAPLRTRPPAAELAVHRPCRTTSARDTTGKAGIGGANPYQPSQRGDLANPNR